LKIIIDEFRNGECCADVNNNEICDIDESEESIEEDGVTVGCIKLCDAGATRCSTFGPSHLSLLRFPLSAMCPKPKP